MQKICTLWKAYYKFTVLPQLKISCSTLNPFTCVSKLINSHNSILTELRSYWFETVLSSKILWLHSSQTPHVMEWLRVLHTTRPTAVRPTTFLLSIHSFIGIGLVQLVMKPSNRVSHISLVNWQSLNSCWMDSSSRLHITHLLAKILCFFLRFVCRKSPTTQQCPHEKINFWG